MNSHKIREYDGPPESSHLEWKTLGTTTRFEEWIFSVEELEQEGPGGRSGKFLRLASPDWVNICAVTRDSQNRECLLMVRQYRHSAEKVALEMPGGLVDPGEDPQTAAVRELLEETGFSAGRIEKAGSANPNAALMGNTMHVFVAADLERTADQELDTNEVIDLELVPLELIAQGKVPEFQVNGVMTLAWYYLSVWLRNGGRV